MSSALEPSTPSSEITPWGPGGRPFARWRAPVCLVALIGLAVVVALMLSTRAPGVIGRTSSELAIRLEREAPRTTERVRERLDRARPVEKDAVAHLLLWAAATFLVGLCSWSWRSLITAVIFVLGAATALELLQSTLSPGRLTEWSDVGANAVGVAIGTVLVVLVTSVSGLPAFVRGLR